MPKIVILPPSGEACLPRYGNSRNTTLWHQLVIWVLMSIFHVYFERDYTVCHTEEKGPAVAATTVTVMTIYRQEYGDHICVSSSGKRSATGTFILRLTLATLSEQTVRAEEVVLQVGCSHVA